MVVFSETMRQHWRFNVATTKLQSNDFFGFSRKEISNIVSNTSTSIMPFQNTTQEKTKLNIYVLYVCICRSK